MRSWTTRSVEETLALGETLAAELAPDGVLLLVGDMGSGKTVLTRGIARGLGIDPEEVQSPTFILVREHAGSRARLAHVDLYRLEADEIAAIGLDEIFAESSVKVVEWADRFPEAPAADLMLEICRGSAPGERRICEVSTTHGTRNDVWEAGER